MSCNTEMPPSGSAFPYHKTLGKGPRPRCIPSVEQIGEHGPVNRSRDARLQHPAHDLADSRIMLGLGEQGSAGDDLAAGIAFALLDPLRIGDELEPRGKLIFGGMID
jgi:hypothetical protein